MLNPKDAAIIVWMPDGETPSAKAYEVPEGKAPETRGYFELGAALAMAVKGPSRQGEKPWIKVGDTLIPPDRQELLYEDFKMGRDLHR